MSRAKPGHLLGMASILLIATAGLLELASLLLFERISGVSFAPSTLAAERETRLLDLRAAAVAGDESPSLYDRHPYLGFAGRPGARPVPGSSIEFNEWGMLSARDHTYPYKRKPRDYAVAVLGGSVAGGFANKGEALLQTELERLDSAFSSRRVVLISLATGGYKEPQQLFHLQYALLSDFEFDLVLNIDGFNDLALSAANSSRGINPIYPSAFQMALVGSSLESSFDPQTLAILADLHAATSAEGRVLGLANSAPMKYSPFVNLVSRQLASRHRALASELKRALAEQAQARSSVEVRGPHLPGEQRPLEIATRLWAESSRMIDATCRAWGLRYIHVLQPNQYVKDSKSLSPEEKRIAYDPSHPWGRIARRGYPRLRRSGEELRTAGVEFYDLSMIFENERETIYTDTCCHFGELGDRLLAKALAERIVAGHGSHPPQ